MALFISKRKASGIFNFLSAKSFSKGLLFLKIWHIKVNYRWNYRPSNLLFRFFRYRLDHINNRQVAYKVAETLTWHNLTKGQSADRILKLWKSCVYDYRPSNMQLLKFWLFNFSNLQTTFIKDFRKKNPGFKIYVGSTDKGLPIQQYLWSEISRQWNNSILIFFFF